MFKNYFTIALRSIWKNKVFSAINIFGLAIGISASLVIYLLVNYDFSFDKFEKDNSRIYRITSLFNFSGEAYHNSGVPSPMGNAVQQQVTGLDVVAFFRIQEDDAKVAIPIANSNPVIFKNQEKMVYADENYFKLIEYKWLAGSAKTSLLQPYQIVLTEANAKLYFQ